MYKLGHGDVGRTLRVTVTATAAGQSASAVSAASEAVAPAALQARKRPKLSGSALDGRVLNVDTGTWRGTPPQSFSYRWQECRPHAACVDIPGATGADYRADTAQIGAKLRAIVTATNAAGSASATSGSSKLVAAGSPVALAPPTIAGTLQEGATLQASAGEWAGTPSISYSFQWLRCSVLGGGCEQIAGATEPSYTPGVEDLASNLAVTVTASNARGSTSATSSETQPILGILPTNSLLPSISGLLRDGGLLSVAPGTWSGTQPISFAYQWRLCDALGQACEDLEGASGQTLQLDPSEIGKTLDVVVTATNAAGSKSLTTSATELIAGILPKATSLPSISGVLRDGALLSGAIGEWSGSAPISYSYQWELCNAAGEACKAIGEAIGATLALSPADVGSTVRLAVKATNVAGATTAFSPASSVIAALLPSNTSLPSIGGLLKLGKELTASTGSWSGTTPMTFGYQWQLCNPLGGGCANILKATSPTFALGALDVGGTLRVIVTATNAAEAALAHPGEARLHGAKRAGQVDVDVALPLLARHPVRGRDRRRDAGVGDAHVDVVERGELVARDVERDVAARLEVERDDVQAVGRQPPRDRGADPAGGAGDERPARLGHNWPTFTIGGGDDDRPLVLRARARAALAPDDGPRGRGARRGRHRAGAAPVRRDEARVADAARPDGLGRARPRLVHPAAARRRRRRRSVA